MLPFACQIKYINNIPPALNCSMQYMWIQLLYEHLPSGMINFCSVNFKSNCWKISFFLVCLSGKEVVHSPYPQPSYQFIILYSEFRSDLWAKLFWIKFQYWPLHLLSQLLVVQHPEHHRLPGRISYIRLIELFAAVELSLQIEVVQTLVLNKTDSKNTLMKRNPARSHKEHNSWKTFIQALFNQ